jgi:thiamine biosynthesis protein ThiS
MVMINGKKVEGIVGTNLKHYLESEGYQLSHIVVEYNEQIIAKEDLEQIKLKEQDQIEVLHFVGGGC